MSDEIKISRRDFIGKTAAASVGVAAASALVGFSAAPTPTTPIGTNTAPAPAGPVADVIVTGAGNGGLSAAIAAAQDGAKVILVEISSKTGGGSAYSGGQLHMMGIRSWEEYVAYTEAQADPDLAKTHCDTFLNTYIPWIKSMGVPFHLPKATRGPAGNAADDWIMGNGEPAYGGLGNRLFFDALQRKFLDIGGTLLLKTRALKLLTDEKGKLTGLRVSTWTKSPTEQGQAISDISAKVVVLATGSFLNNPEMMTKYLGPNADLEPIMATPYSRGDGILMGQELGASMSESLSNCTGLVRTCTDLGTAEAPRRQTEHDPDLFEKAIAKWQTQQTGTNPANLNEAVGGFLGILNIPWVSNHYPKPSVGVVVNLDGKRFWDENSPMDNKSESRQGMAILRQRGGMAFYVADKAIFDMFKGTQVILDFINKHGGTAMTANTVQDLGTALAGKFSFYASNFVKTIADYNAALEAKTQPDPPRYVLPSDIEPNGGRYKISTPPFYVVAVRPAIAMAHGGLAINTAAQVLDMQKKPIPGLYATWPCAGGIMGDVYTGAIGLAGTFGYIAGKSAAKYIKPS